MSVRNYNYTVDQQGKLDIYAIEPKMYVDAAVNTGFTEYAEKINGRFAMIGFISLIALEVLTGNSLINLLKSL